jgi:hypothetical protein
LSQLFDLSPFDFPPFEKLERKSPAKKKVNCKKTALRLRGKNLVDKNGDEQKQ